VSGQVIFVDRVLCYGNGVWAFSVFAYTYMLRKYKKEMARLETRFGEEYRQYASYCGSLIPRLKPYARSDNRKWSVSLFWHENREQNFILIVVLIAVAIIFR